MLTEKLLEEFLLTKCPLANKFDSHGLLKTQLSIFYEFLEEKGIIKNNGGLAEVSSRAETKKHLDEIFGILDEACKEVDNGIYNPKLEALKTILDTYKISKYGV